MRLFRVSTRSPAATEPYAAQAPRRTETLDLLTNGYFNGVFFLSVRKQLVE